MAARKMFLKTIPPEVAVEIAPDAVGLLGAVPGVVAFDKLLRRGGEAG